MKDSNCISLHLWLYTKHNISAAATVKGPFIRTFTRSWQVGWVPGLKTNSSTKPKQTFFCLVKQARHNNQMLTPFSLLSLWPNGQEDRQRFISLCPIVYLAACGTLNKWSVVGDVLSNHVPARRPEAKQVQNMILVALAPVHGLWIYIILIPDRKFWGKMCWKIEIYFGLTQELQPTSVSVLLLNDI